MKRHATATFLVGTHNFTAPTTDFDLSITGPRAADSHRCLSFNHQKFISEHPDNFCKGQRP